MNQFSNAKVVRLAGDIRGAECDCLARFWSQVVQPAAGSLRLDMTEVTDIDAPAIAILVDLVRQAASLDQPVVVESPPQMLAHTLYKVGALGPIVIEQPRNDVPSAG